MKCSLVVFKSDGTRKDIPLAGPRNVIGRMSNCEVRIPLNSVSREHCEIVCDGSVLKYKDLNSSNGVIHNGAKSKQGQLRPGDELVIGPVVFTVVIDGKPAKISPVRTILDEADDKAVATAMDSKAGDGKPEVKGSSRVGTALAPALASVALPAMPSREIGSSGEQVQALKADSDFEEFNNPAPQPAGKPAGKKTDKKAAVPALPEPIGDDDDEKAPAGSNDSGELEFSSEGGDLEFSSEDDDAPAFTFE